MVNILTIHNFKILLKCKGNDLVGKKSISDLVFCKRLAFRGLIFTSSNSSFSKEFTIFEEAS